MASRQDIELLMQFLTELGIKDEFIMKYGNCTTSDLNTIHRTDLIIGAFNWSGHTPWLTIDNLWRAFLKEYDRRRD